MSVKWLGLLCCLVIVGILTLGLWPFHSPANDAVWMNPRGLRLNGEGSLISPRTMPTASDGYSVEIWASADRDGGGATLMTLHSADSADCPEVRLTRSWSDLKLQTRQEKSYFQVLKRNVFVDEVFQPRRRVFITVTSGLQGTRVFVNGERLRSVETLRVFDCEYPARLILGDAPGQSDGWSGEILGLATYRRELATDQVQRHFHSWTQSGQPALDPSDANQTLFLLREAGGTVAHDEGPASMTLEMPRRYTVVDKKTLAGFWDEFSSTPGYWQDFANNIVGFIPVGFCFVAYLMNRTSAQRPALFAVLLGLLLSLTIECTQPFLATRESGTTDLLTNTSGTILGVLLYPRVTAAWLRHFGRPLFH